MNTSKWKRVALILILVLLTGVAMWATLTQAAPGKGPSAQSGGAPTVVSYQGEVRVGGTPYTGTGYFKFAVVDSPCSNRYWSNDGTGNCGTAPTATVQLAVSDDGLFSVLLGDTGLSGMTQPLTADVFSEPNRYLRVWFSSDNITFNQLTPDTRIASVPYALQAERVRGYGGVVVVAKSGGDYTSVQAAIDSIAGAAADNPYLVWVAPGVYSETVTMKSYVHLQGAGQEATIVTSTASSSAWPPAQATLVLASDASLRDLTVGNSGTGDSNPALLAMAGTTRTLVADVTARALGGGQGNYGVFLSGSGTGVTLQQVTALAENGSTSNISLLNYSGAAAVLRGGYFTGRGGNDTRGIFNLSTDATLEAESVTALAENGSNSNFGLYNYGGAAATLHGGSFTGRGGATTRGMENANSGSTLTAEGVTALAENGSSENYGLGSYDGVTTTLRCGAFVGRGGTNAYGISNGANGATLEAESVTALAENGSSNNYGMNSDSGGATTLRGGSFTGRGGANAYGIYNVDSGTTLDAESVAALGENGSNSNYGLENINAAATLRGGSFTGRGGQDGTGILNWGGNGILEAVSVTALGENGSSTNRGLYNWGSAAADVTQSVLEGATYSVLFSSGTITVSNSRLVGGGVSGSVTCVLVTRGITVTIPPDLSCP